MTTKPTNTFLGIETTVSGEVRKFAEGTAIPSGYTQNYVARYDTAKAPLQASNTFSFSSVEGSGEVNKNYGSLIASSKSPSQVITQWQNKVPDYVNGYYFLRVYGGFMRSPDLNSWEYINLFEQSLPSRRNSGNTNSQETPDFITYDAVKKLYIAFFMDTMYVSADSSNWVMRKQFHQNYTYVNYIRINQTTAVVLTTYGNYYIATTNNWASWSVYSISGTANPSSNVQYNGNLVVYGSGGTSYKTTDGVTFSTFSTPWPTSGVNSFQYLVHDSRLYAIVIYNSTSFTHIYSTNDFANWTTHTTSLSIGVNFRTATSYNGKIWAIDSASTPRKVLYSTTGDTWAESTIERFADLPLTNPLQLYAGNSESIYNLNERLVIRLSLNSRVGGKPSPIFATSLDGKNWMGCTYGSENTGVQSNVLINPSTLLPALVTHPTISILKEGSTSYSVSGTSFYTSNDNFVNNINFTSVISGTINSRYMVKRNNTLITFGTGGITAHSTDGGVTWTRTTQSGVTNNSPIIQKTSFDTYVIPGQNSSSRYILTTSFAGDVPSFTRSASMLPNGADGAYSYSLQYFVEYPVGTYVIFGKKALASNNTAFTWCKWTSTDQGSNWTIDETPILFAGQSPRIASMFTYGGKVFATTGQGLLSSTDMINWTAVANVPKIFLQSTPTFLADRVVLGGSNSIIWSKDGVSWKYYDFYDILQDQNIPTGLITPGTNQSVTSDSSYMYVHSPQGVQVRFNLDDNTGATATILGKVNLAAKSLTSARPTQIGGSTYILNDGYIFVSSNKMKTWKKLANIGISGVLMYTDGRYLYVPSPSALNGSVTPLYKVCPSSGAFEIVNVAHPYADSVTSTLGSSKNNFAYASNGSGTLVVGLAANSAYTPSVLVLTNYGQAAQVVALPGTSSTSTPVYSVTYFEGVFYAGTAFNAPTTDYWTSPDGITWTKLSRYSQAYPIYFYRCFSKIFALSYAPGSYYQIYEVVDINNPGSWIFRLDFYARCFSPWYNGVDNDDSSNVSFSALLVQSMYPIGEYNGYFYAVLGDGVLCRSSNGYQFDAIEWTYGGACLAFYDDSIVNFGIDGSRKSTQEIRFKAVGTPNQSILEPKVANPTEYIYNP